MSTTQSPDWIALSLILAMSLNQPVACSSARSLVSSLDTRRNLAGASPDRLPRMSPTQPCTTCALVTRCPFGLTRKPVPVWSNSLSGLAGAESAPAAVATGLAAGRTEKSPALATPDCLVLATQFAKMGNRRTADHG